ncbi:dynein heavy chain 10, axonemal-like [Sinocyclocheilus rhinocerous]|uniref:dynein heavy chain 10, axonemal-like n=1 Tax=Sinocyclocheilus rhinocerous TaxID=307959 RepID=UPI0007B96A85|nr:PREDICTED: dynein heavy chain 10, axonemal-like [Sinocyclocheilus rhinocerous]
MGYYTQAARDVWTLLIELQPQTGDSGGGISRDEYISQVARDIQSKLPEVFDLDVIRKKLGLEISPTSVVLLQELERFNKLTLRMIRSLAELQRALAGEVGMSSELDEVARALFNGQIPVIWRKLAPDTLKSLGNWMIHFKRRHEQYSSWVDEGEPCVMWLSGLHIPESYLTALVQATCRKNGWPLDHSTLYTQVTHYRSEDEVKERPGQGCFVSGLYLEGADWDIEKGCLVRSKPRVLVSQLPILKIIPIEARRLKLQNTLRTPVYTTSMRRNAMGVGLVFEADLFTTKHISHWVLQGVMYGGRAIDSFDRRILTVYMDEYLGDFIFDTFQPFHFFHSDSGGGISRDEYISQVARDIQSKLPEVFDLDVIHKKWGLEISPTSVYCYESWNALTNSPSG